MTETDALNERQKQVLEIVAVSHIRSASPIGSGYVSRILDLSSATIRNVMGELEDMGYISKPHTSAGRVPTTSGYRYYVRRLLRLKEISQEDRNFIETEYRRPASSVEAMLDKVSHLLSVMTKQAGVACVSNLKFYIDGASNMMDMPEFRSLERMKLLFRLFEEKRELMKLFEEDLDSEGVKIHIGEKDRFEMLGDMSLITANYRMKDREKGSLGIIGPMRMNYSVLIPLVDAVSASIEAAFDYMETL